MTDVDFSALEDEDRRYVEAFPRKRYKIREVPGVGKFYVDDIEDGIKTWLHRGVVWEQHLIDLFRTHVRRGTIAIDAGAHVGTHTLTLSRLVGPRGRVLAFEPQRKLHRELVHNLRLNGIANVSAIRCALGDVIARVRMRAPVPGNEGGTAVGRGGDAVAMRTIDSLAVENISLMKIDVEGYEDQLIAGATRTLARQLPTLVIEIQGGHVYDTAPARVKRQIDNTRAALEKLGYEVQHIETHDYLATARAGRRRSRSRR
jgi:FkbM family methyltransferase